jgi:uncharacterized protein (TIGR03083 family)
MANSETTTIDTIAESCARIEQVCSGLDEDGWHRPTSLPVWDVQDVVAHLGSLEALLLERDEPTHHASATAHVRNPLGELNERMVDRRRSWPGARVLDEFRDVTTVRLEQLRALDEAGLDREVLAPNGRMVPLRAFLGIRLWDYLVHELDICAALDQPLPLNTTAARRVLDEMLLLLPRAAGKAGAPEGTTVLLEIGDPLPRSAAARIDGGRGVPMDPAAGEASLHLRASPAAFLMVGSGRQSADDAIASGAVEVTGDAELAARTLTLINVVP